MTEFPRVARDDGVLPGNDDPSLPSRDVSEMEAERSANMGGGVLPGSAYDDRVHSK